MSGRLPTEPPDDAVAPVRHPDAPAPGELIQSHYAVCFACGADHPAGLHMRLYADDGLSVRAELDVGEHHQGAPGLAHGGLLAAAFDEVLGALNWLVRYPAVTVRLETDFRRPVPVGTTLYITAECVAIAGRKIYSRAVGRLGAPDGPVGVEAAAVFIAVPIEHFRDNGRAEDVAAFISSGDRTAVTSAFEVNP